MTRTLATALAAALALPACLGCTARGALDGLELQITVSGGALPPDQYAIVVEADGMTMTILETLAADGGGSVSDPQDVEVAGGNHLFLFGGLNGGGKDGLLTVGYREGGGPADVVVSVRRGASVLGRQEYQPHYEAYRPNGVGCAPTVYRAQSSLTITP